MYAAHRRRPASRCRAHVHRSLTSGPRRKKNTKRAPSAPTQGGCLSKCVVPKVHRDGLGVFLSREGWTWRLGQLTRSGRRRRRTGAVLNGGSLPKRRYESGEKLPLTIMIKVTWSDKSKRGGRSRRRPIGLLLSLLARLSAFCLCPLNSQNVSLAQGHAIRGG
jgi:hypothetical protein